MVLIDQGINPAEQRREEDAEKSRRKAAAESLKTQTVEALFTAYTDLLKQREKVDARDAELTLKRFLAANETLAAKPAHAAIAADFGSTSRPTRWPRSAPRRRAPTSDR